jgi:hypothetical protein
MNHSLAALVRQINARDRGVLRLGSKTLTVIRREGLDPDHGRFNLFEMRWSGRRRRPRLTCFVGHRFTRAISGALRFNLRHCLEPSNIALVWSGMDLNAAGFFDAIIRQIRACDFCIFDNRRAEQKPNVYIESGIAYALGKPFIFADYRGNRIRIPSDLRHITTIPYDGYRDLTRRLYFQLPIFLRASRLM